MPVEIDKTDGHLSITLASPATMNALGPEMVETLIRNLMEKDGISSCTIRGAGKNFCAGFDLSDIDHLSDGDLLHRFLRIETLLQLIHHAPFPVIALCQGHVIGAGADLVAACWKRIADPSAKFRMPGWNFELALGTRRLARLIGAEHASDLLIDTRRVGAAEALGIGLVSHVAKQDAWNEFIQGQILRGKVLSPFATTTMFDLTLPDTRAQDIAAIVATAGRPGLKDRIQTYGAAARKNRGV